MVTTRKTDIVQKIFKDILTAERTVGNIFCEEFRAQCGRGADYMQKSNTKEAIVEAALDLFSVNGYEATSISQLADAVGIRKASLYSHFANKEDILNSVVETVLKGYAGQSIFVNANWDDPEFTRDKTDVTAGDVAELVQRQIRYILHDPHISKGRKLLMIEQFRNDELAELQTRLNYQNALNYFTGMMKFLIREGILKNADTGIMAAQFSSPITVWINLCDREPEREEEVMGLIGKHVLQFFEIYRK